MNSLEIFKQGKGNRDVIFQELLTQFNKQPVNILEIGCQRSSSDGRSGDGWSTFHWAEYINNYGGSLDVCDISFDSLNAARTAIQPYFTQNITYNLELGVTFLRNNKNKIYNLIYLDGSDDPNEMLAEFEIAKNQTELILCDDFYSKGSILRLKYPIFRLYKWSGCDHELALYGVDNKVIFLERITD